MINFSIKGIIRAIKVKTFSILVDNINGLNKEELASLSGITGNVQTQLSELSDKLQEVADEQANFKGKLAAEVQKKNDLETTLGASSVLSDFINAIKGIVTLKEGTDDATAVASNILRGETAYAKGAKLTGTLDCIEDYYLPEEIILNYRDDRDYYTDADGDEHNNIYYDDDGNEDGYEQNFISVYYGCEDRVIDSSSKELMIPASEFGNAWSGLVRKGYTFTSINGLNILGTMNEIKDYFYHPNATIQMRKGRTSYTNDLGNTVSCSATDFISVYAGTSGCITSSSNEIMMLASRFGNATADDVVQGKTFTSEKGLNVSGTVSQVDGGISIALKHYPSSENMQLRCEMSTPLLFRKGSYVYLGYSDVAKAIKLTSGMIVSGKTVLGVEGSVGLIATVESDYFKNLFSERYTYNSSEYVFIPNGSILEFSLPFTISGNKSYSIYGGILNTIYACYKYSGDTIRIVGIDNGFNTPVNGSAKPRVISSRLMLPVYLDNDLQPIVIYSIENDKLKVEFYCSGSKFIGFLCNKTYNVPKLYLQILSY